MSSSESINERLCKDLKKKLTEYSYYGVSSSNPARILFNYKDEIIKSILVKEKIEKYHKLFPENQLLKELLS